VSQTAKLGDVAEVVAGVGFPKDMQGRAEGDVPVFKVGDISMAWTAGESVLRSSRNYLAADEALKLGRPVPAGSTVFAKIGEALRLNRRAVLGQPSLVDNNVMGLVPRVRTLAPMYLFYFMQTIDLGKLSRATAVPSIRKSDVVQIDIPLPSLDEQASVVAEVEKQFSRLDEAVANLKRVKANLKRYKAAVLADAVEGALAGEREGWMTARLGDIASSVRNGISIKPVGESGTRILRISAVRPMALDLDDVRHLAQALDDFDSFRLAAGDTLFTRYNGSIDLVGVCAAVPELSEPTVYPDKLIRVRVPTDTLLPSFLVIAASTGEARAFIRSRIRTTAGQAGVSGADIKGIPLRVPPLAEQRRIVAEVDRRLSVVRELEAELDANLLRADALRRTTLANSFAMSN